MDGRDVKLPTGDALRVLLCKNHLAAYDAIMWAERQRALAKPSE